MGHKQRYRELPQGVTLCAFCDEHERSAQAAHDLAKEVNRLRDEVVGLKNGDVHRELARANSDLRSKLYEAETKARLARREAVIAQATCPLCGWQPNEARLRLLMYRADGDELRRSLRGHALRVHGVGGRS